MARLTQAMVNNPAMVLTNAIAGQNIVSTTVLRISTTDLNPPTSGGGTSNIAFQDGAAGGPNAQAAQMDAIFWIETIQGNDPDDKRLQLQYTQSVLLNFNGLSWPHVSVATLHKCRTTITRLVEQTTALAACGLRRLIGRSPSVLRALMGSLDQGDRMACGRLSLAL